MDTHVYAWRQNLNYTDKCILVCEIFFPPQ